MITAEIKAMKTHIKNRKNNRETVLFQWSLVYKAVESSQVSGGKTLSSTMYEAEEENLFLQGKCNFKPLTVALNKFS